MNVQLNDEKHISVWGLTNSGQYTVNSLYLDLINDDTKYLKKYIWKMKVPLKIKIFLWFLHRKEILTKDNLIRRNWVGRESCCFCDGKESIQHIFFGCPFTKIIWRIIHMTFGLSPPKNITNLFVNWLKGIPKKELIKIRVGVCAVIWTMWNIRNDFIFNKSKKIFIFAGYPYGHPLDPYVVLSQIRGGAGGDGLWVQPFGDRCSRFIQPARLVVA
jgi:hypothetical protein